jgi:NADP-dependent 3-hydroxy acid dehydrogenase YdfG
MTLSQADTALVTGASSGIGEAIVRALRSRGVIVHAAARRLDRLERLAQEVGCIPLELDVRDRAAVAALEHSHEIDILVNNAGLGRALGNLATADLDDIERSIDTNLTAAIQMTRSVLPGMIARRKGHLVNISSTAAIHPGSTALYGATKAAIHKLSRDLRGELKGLGVRVSEINPGRVTTEFYEVAIDDTEQRAKAQNTGITELSPSDVAASVIHVLDAPWHVNISQLEIVPVEQVYGGYVFAPEDRS